MDNFYHNLEKDLKKYFYILRLDKSDIDLFIKNNFKIKDIIQFLENNGFIIDKNSFTNYSFSAYKFLNNNLINLDIQLSWNYLKKYIPLNSNLDELIKPELYLKDDNYRRKIDLLRYIFLLKSGKKLYNNINLLPTIYREFDLLFLKKRKISELIYEIKKNKQNFSFKFFNIIKFFNFKTVFIIYWNKIKLFFKIFNKGKIIVLEGVDGVGKSTLGYTFQNSNEKFKFYYFWNKEIFIKKFEDRLKKLGKFGVLFYNILLYFNLLIKYIKIFHRKLRNRIVFLDRHPLVEYYILAKKNKFWIPFYFLYKILFPKPDLFIILTADLKEINQRKKELKNKEIIRQQNILKKFFSENKGNTVLLKNESLENTLNSILKLILN